MSMLFTPYLTEFENGISLLADGHFGFVFRPGATFTLPQHPMIQQVQILQVIAAGDPVCAVRTKVKIEYRGNLLRTIADRNYASKKLSQMGAKALSIVDGIRSKFCEREQLVSAADLAPRVGTKPLFFYARACRGTANDLVDRVDFSFVQEFGKDNSGREVYVFNTDDPTAVHIMQDAGFWPIALPPQMSEQAKAVFLPLGAVPRFLSNMRIYALRVA